MFCVTMWLLFNLSPSVGGLSVGAGLGRRQPPRGAAGRGQQRCSVLVLLWHTDVQGGPSAGETQRRAGSRQVTVLPHPISPRVWVQGVRGGTAQPAWLEGTPSDCCCVGDGSGGGLRVGWGDSGRDWSCQADCELPRVVHCVGASLQPLWHQESLLWERCCLPHRIPPCLPRTMPAAPRSDSQRVGISPLLPSLSCCCSDLIPSLVGF